MEVNRENHLADSFRYALSIKLKERKRLQPDLDGWYWVKFAFSPRPYPFRAWNRKFHGVGYWLLSKLSKVEWIAGPLDYPE